MKLYEGQQLPLGYGVAWRNLVDMSYTCYLVPFNILARWVREFYFFLAKPNRDEELAVYRKGYNVGNTKAVVSLIRIKDNFSAIYIRGLVEGKWGSYSLQELWDLGQYDQVWDWIIERVKDGKEA